MRSQISVKHQNLDNRLLGTWKSSRAKTIEFWGFRKDSRVGPKKRAEIAKIFGILTWRFTRTRMYMQYEDYKAVTKYKVLASDENSVVLEWTEAVSDSLVGIDDFESSLLQVFFDGKNAIRIVSGYNQEFFRRVRT